VISYTSLTFGKKEIPLRIYIDDDVFATPFEQLTYHC
jgi:hypothetical protein